MFDCQVIVKGLEIGLAVRTAKFSFRMINCGEGGGGRGSLYKTGKSGGHNGKIIFLFNT